MTTPDYTDWMATYTGKRFFPFLPGRDMDAIHIRDIAHALSMQCRYGGHCKRFYSVAEHSVHLARFVLRDRVRSDATLSAAMWALLHDASEAYVADIVRPAKRGLPEYKRMEDGIMAAIAERFKLTEVMPAYVDQLDRRILLDERKQNMRDQDTVWQATQGLEPLGITLEYWHPSTAEDKFLGMYYNIIEEQTR